MDKLSNYMTDFDNVNLPLTSKEIEYILNKPYDVNKIRNEVKSPIHNYIYRSRNNKSHIELPSNARIKKLVNTDSTFAFVSTEHEFFILYDHIQYFEKIANHIKDCIAGTGVFLLITENNKVLFVNASNGEIIDDTYWTNENDSARYIYTIENKFIIHTTNNNLYLYDGCTSIGFTINELDNIVQDVIVTYDTITVLTCDNRVWVYGNKEHGAYITDGRGFIPHIFNAKQVVRTVRAGAILTSDNDVWSWGDVMYGGSPRPNWVKGINGKCKKLLNTGTSIMAVTLSNQLWAWSNQWFKIYDLQESDYAIASCIRPQLRMDNIDLLSKNKTSWIIKTREGPLYYIGETIKTFSDLIDFDIYTNGYIWIFYNELTRDAILLNDYNYKTYRDVDVYFYAPQIIIQRPYNSDAYIHNIIVSPFGKINDMVYEISGQIVNILLTKYGTIFTTTTNDIYKDCEKLDYKFENVVHLLNNKNEMIALLQVDKSRPSQSNSSSPSHLLSQTPKIQKQQVIKNSNNKSIMTSTPSTSSTPLKKKTKTSLIQIQPLPEEDNEEPLIQIQPFPEENVSERYIELEKVDNTKTMFIVIILLIIVAIIMTFLIFKRN